MTARFKLAQRQGMGSHLYANPYSSAFAAVSKNTYDENEGPLFCNKM